MLAALVAALVVWSAGGGVAQGVSTCLLSSSSGPGCPPRLEFELDGSVRPAKLPKGAGAPITVGAVGTVNRGEAAALSALREMVVDIDGEVSLDAEGLPSCGARRLAGLGSSEVRRACRAAIVGRGTAEVALVPEGRKVSAPLTLVNAGVRGGTTTLLVHSPVAAGSPEAEVVLATVKINKRPKKELGSRAIVRIPPIAGGGGALSSFSFELGHRFGFEGKERSYLMASCQTGKLETRFDRLRFRNEANSPGLAPTAELIGGIVTPCTPTG